ncbi:phage tail tube protein [Micromonospora okii]|uniref:phage tail tube protein n=1 Tax=Micromonospora okii TaxID=1182970 RepID=UPI001E44DBA2|nr:hypothetical protein [Micromonospora okii]
MAVNQWTGADVYTAPPNTAGPSDLASAWADPWDVAGLLDGAEGFTEERDGDTSEFYAWGGKLVKVVRSKHKRTITFVAMEDSDVVFALRNPGSTRTTSGGVTTSVIRVPETRETGIGFETREGVRVKRRIVKRAVAEVDGEIKESEEAPTLFKIKVTIYPEADGTLYTEIEGDVTPTP